MKSNPPRKGPPPLPKQRLVAVYAGSFDPFTKGHFDIIGRASNMYNHLHIAVALNVSKNALFSTEERVKMLRATLMYPNVTITEFDGLIVDFCKKVSATVMIRGVRNVIDFESEIIMAHVNRDLAPNIQTVLLPTQLEYSTISSSMVKELARFKRDVSAYVHPHVAMALKEKFK